MQFHSENCSPETQAVWVDFQKTTSSLWVLDTLFFFYNIFFVKYKAFQAKAVLNILFNFQVTYHELYFITNWSLSLNTHKLLCFLYSEISHYIVFSKYILFMH